MASNPLANIAPEHHPAVFSYLAKLLGLFAILGQSGALTGNAAIFGAAAGALVQTMGSQDAAPSSVEVPTVGLSAIGPNEAG
jgi:hypothetical protein